MESMGKTTLPKDQIHRLTKLLQTVILDKPMPAEELETKAGVPELCELQETVAHLVKCLSEGNAFLEALCAGDLAAPPPSRDNFLAGRLKELHSRLNHIAWQASCVAEGDYSQSLSFFGDFSAAFNKMTRQLAEREEGLRKKTAELDHLLALLLSMMDRQTESIFVLDADTKQLLYFNQRARERFFDADGNLPASGELTPLYEYIKRRTLRGEVTGTYTFDVGGRYFTYTCYAVAWSNRSAVVYTIAEKTAEVREKEALTDLAYQDPLTGVFNRRYSEKLFYSLDEEEVGYSLVFADLDHLKYVNDTFGHGAGDTYLLDFVASLRRCLRGEDRICRVGGDEFLIFLPSCAEETARERMEQVVSIFVAMESAHPRSFSYGVEYVAAGQRTAYEEVYHRLDGKMYAAKRRRGKRRGSA